MANAASKHTPADREYIGSLSPHILMEFRDYLFNPTYITINAAKFLDYEWIDITLLREYVSVLGASTTRSLPILDQVHVKIEAVPPSVSTVSVKAEPDVQHVASVKTRTLHSQIPADIWDATPSTTNTNEAQHHWTNSLTGTKLTPVEALESRRRVDQNVADEIKMSLKTGILSNSNNELSHRMARNSQRQSAVARRATESRDAANVSKDLQRRIDEEAEKRRLSNETTKFLKAQLKDAKASSSGRVSSAPARRGNIGVIFHFLQVPTPAAPVQSDYVPSAPVATSTSGEELAHDEYLER
ncbi:hypothetical protein B0H10DRAFT_1947995 [Mycena sp. CBHHK59/15]|nr:hypothetical protein B0H10DRAFT_1947995 [Mycena sp. CBHHK59/15]